MMNRCCYSDKEVKLVVRGSDEKIKVYVEGLDNRYSLYDCIVRARITAGGLGITVEKQDIISVSDDSVILTFSTSGLGFGQVSVSLILSIPDKDFADKKLNVTLKDSPKMKIIGG